MVERIAVTGKEITLASVNSCACLVLKEAGKHFPIAPTKRSNQMDEELITTLMVLEVLESKQDRHQRDSTAEAFVLHRASLREKFA
jgi:hypothetical protein